MESIGGKEEITLQVAKYMLAQIDQAEAVGAANSLCEFNRTSSYRAFLVILTFHMR